LQDCTGLNMLQSDEAHLKKLKHFQEATQRASGPVLLPFPVRET